MKCVLGERFSLLFCRQKSRMCVRKVLSLMASDSAVKASAGLWSSYQMLFRAPQTISGIFLSSKTVAIAESEPENTYTVLSWARMLFLFFLLWYVFL